MKVFFIPVINGFYDDTKTTRFADKPWQNVRDAAIKYFGGDADYVSQMMDGKGYIEIKSDNGKFRYVQE